MSSRGCLLAPTSSRLAWGQGNVVDGHIVIFHIIAATLIGIYAMMHVKVPFEGRTRLGSLTKQNQRHMPVSMSQVASD